MLCKNGKCCSTVEQTTWLNLEISKMTDDPFVKDKVKKAGMKVSLNSFLFYQLGLDLLFSC